MINNFVSPQTNDPIKKLQNLLNNCLHSIIDVFSNLSYAGDFKELEIVPEHLSEYSHFINLIEERKKKTEGKENGELGEQGEKNNIIDQPQNVEKKYFIKPNFDKSTEEEILDRVERMNLILSMIDQSIDELPDSEINEEQVCKEMKRLQKIKDDSKKELKRLYKEYDYIYNYATENLRNFIVNTEE
ncbi:large ribosomal subunit processing factor, putative [Plasmodium vinckei vinckei]|uniref:Large ribosomal subunit processing factor, putative n=1 Tax=Plasmodium vinckei vinckei TaxID=54757 RepID=A0A449C007_PLAVN|nr:large ribosomal subunit processing factor, putative [Plasmodium vinckei vinckei]VEV59016.1 large ribosomal subunit processing factor, putative [Plasmodium vinckei vinckei]